MPDEKRQKLKDIFDAALQKRAADRQRFLDEKCAGDDALRREIESLLDSFDVAGNFMQEAAISEVADVIAGETSPEKRKYFGHYEVLKQIGTGGMGEVYLARDRKLDRMVALKILNKAFNQHEINRSRFIQEARAASSLNHPNILIIHEIGETEGLHFLVSEYIEGKTLREIIIEMTLNLSGIMDVSIQVANALVTAHRANLVHRDIKPENIMVRPDGLVKILDFGLAKLLEQKKPISGFTDELTVKNETGKGIIMGTVSYMSPEQARGEPVDERTDIFSLGTLLYEMITGRTPFGCETVSETWTKLLHLEPEPLARFVPDVPAELEEIIAKMLRKNTEERYQTAKDLLADLQVFKKQFELKTEFERRSPAPPKPTLVVTEAFEPKTTGEIPLLPPNNLTENFSPIIGREKEIAEIRDLLRTSGVRLLTLTGIGGTGKTTLAKAVAKASLTDFKDGVFYIEIGAITNPELVIPTIAQPLGVTESGDKPILEVLKDFLRKNEILLAVDNFEQVIEAAAQIAELISAAPKLKILITSRVRLHLSAEREFVILPLAVPSEFSQISPAEFLKFEAVRLFADRAQNTKPSFTLTEENARFVAEICSRLDGLPLAIELAAARIKILSPSAILAKLENRLKLLTGGARDLPSRQQTMRGAVEWSCELLSEDEKTLFRRLAVFVGGFTFDAAEFVAEGEGDSAIALSVLDGITSLVDKSLLVSKEQFDGEIRFRMLEVVREFALEMLETSGEFEKARGQHAVYFLKLAEDAEPFLQTESSAQWLDRLENDYDNLRAVLQWSLGRNAEILMRVTAAIPQFWGIRGYVSEGCGWLEKSLKQAAKAPPEIRFKLINWYGTLKIFLGDYATAVKIVEDGLNEAERLGNKKYIAFGCRNLGRIAYQQNDLAKARMLYEKGLKVNRELDYPMGLAYSLVLLGDVFRTEGNRPEARKLFEESLVILRELNNKQAIAANLNNLGCLAYDDGDYQTAFTNFVEGFALSREIGDKTGIVYFLDGFAALYLKRGNFEQAAKLAGAVEFLIDSVGFKMELAERQFRENYLCELRGAMNEEEFGIAFEQGKKLKMDEILALTEAQT